MTSPSPTPGALPQDRRSSLAHSQAAARGQALTPKPSPRTRNREVDDGRPPPDVERSLGDLVVHLYSRCSGPPEDFYADVLVPSFEDKKRRKAIIARLGWDAPTFRRLEAEAAARLEADIELSRTGTITLERPKLLQLGASHMWCCSSKANAGFL